MSIFGGMEPITIVSFIAGYFALLLAIAWFTSRRAGNADFFIGNKKSRWYLVALGMVGDSLSGVTFISVPGAVLGSKFHYLQVVLGYFVGYFIIALVLLPLYYRLNLISIYSYLRGRFGVFSQKTGSFYFLLSRLLGAAGRLYLAAGTLQIFVFDAWKVPFEVSVMIMILLMLAYTFKGGIKTLVWTDSLQSVMLLTGLVLGILALFKGTGMSLPEISGQIATDYFASTFNMDPLKASYFWKHFIGGAFIAICMTGLDQNMMQKNLSCPNVKDAQKNIYWFSGIMLVVTVLFLCLGAMLYIYAAQNNINLAEPGTDIIITDKVFPRLALEYLGPVTALAFILGLTAATFSSADSVLATLTTAFCIDFLGFETNPSYTEQKKKKTRYLVHISFSVLLYFVILGFQLFNDRAIINTILNIANYTYGPLLGLFAFGILTKISTRDPWVPLVCVISPIFCYILQENGPAWFGGYEFGFELLLLNGMITFLGLWLLSLGNKSAKVSLKL